MIAYSLVVLSAFFFCIMFPIYIATADYERGEKLPDRHFLKG